MRCLTDIELQLVADEEASAPLGAHVEQCEACRNRVTERRQVLAQVAALAGSIDPSAHLSARVHQAIAGARPARGSTVLRPTPMLRRPVWATVAFMAVVIALVAFGVLPRVGPPTTLSASQIIDRSLAQMTTGQGVELLEYELRTMSTYRQQAGLSEGPFRIVQIFDRGNPARFRFLQFNPDGELVSATAQNPAESRRTELTRVDGRNYIVRLTSLPGPMLSIPELLQTQAASILRMMQLDADEHLTIEDGPDGRRFVIEMPEAERTQLTGPLDLSRVRIVIDGTDYRVEEAAVAGTLLGHAFDVTFTLITQIKAANIQPDDWEVPQGPDDVVIEGVGTGEPFDSMALVLRELGTLRGR